MFSMPFRWVHDLKSQDQLVDSKMMGKVGVVTFFSKPSPAGDHKRAINQM